MEKFTLKILDFLLTFSVSFMTFTSALIGYLFVNFEKISPAKIAIIMFTGATCGIIAISLVIMYFVYLFRLRRM